MLFQKQKYVFPIVGIILPLMGKVIFTDKLMYFHELELCFHCWKKKLLQVKICFHYWERQILQEKLCVFICRKYVFTTQQPVSKCNKLSFIQRKYYSFPYGKYQCFHYLENIFISGKNCCYKNTMHLQCWVDRFALLQICFLKKRHKQPHYYNHQR